MLLALLCASLFLRDGLLPTRALLPYPLEQIDAYRAEALAAGTLDPGAARAGATAGGDKILQSLCWDRVLHDRLAAGESPRWTKDIGGGAAFVPQMSQVYEPINLLLLLLPSWGWYGPWMLCHLGLFGWFAYCFVRRLGLSHFAGLVAVVAATLGLWTQCKLHHNVILTAALSLWPMLTAVHALVAERNQGIHAARWIGWLALWTGLSWLSGFAVVSLQVSYLTVAFALLLALRNERGQRVAALLAVALGMLLGGLLSAAHMLPVLAAAAESARDAAPDAAFLASNGLEKAHWLSALWPDLLAWSSDRFYADPAAPWRDITRMPWAQIVLLDHPLHPSTGGPFQSWVETSFAVGTLPTAFAVQALASRRWRAIAWFFAGAGLLAFGFANADQPLLAVARWLPGLAAADLRRVLFLVAMALVVLAAIGADEWQRGARKLTFATCALTACGSLWLLWFLLQHGEEASFLRGLAAAFVADREHPVVQSIGGSVDQAVAFLQQRSAPGEWLANYRALAATAWRSLLAASLGGLLLGLHDRTARQQAACWLLLASTGAELLHAGAGFFVTEPIARISTPPRALAPALAYREAADVRGRMQRLMPKTDARAAGLYPPNLAAAHGLEDAAGYNPLPPRRFEELWLAIEPDQPDKASVVFGGAGVGSLHDERSLQHPLLDLLGVRFILTQLALPERDLLTNVTPSHCGDLRLYERTSTLPRATFVRSVDLLPDKALRLSALSDPHRDVQHRIVLEDARAPMPAPHASNDASVDLIEHRDEQVTLRCNAPADGYVRLHDPYDAGWTATIDGQVAPVYAADHYLRAVYVGPGEHEIIFRFNAARVLWPERLSLLALVVIAALLLAREPRR